MNVTRRPAWSTVWPWLAAVLLAFTILGPVLISRGFALRGDMVFVPHQPWKSAWLGLDGSVPRAVPMDAFVSLATYVVPGWVVQHVLLTAILVLGVVGADRMVRAGGRSWPWFARLGVMVFFVWNPWVAERLLIGQWAIVGGYAVLPWVVVAALRVRDDLRAGWPELALCLLVAGVFSPSSGVMAVAVSLAVVAGRPAWRALVAVGGLALVANLPWVLPALRVDGSIETGEAFAAFAARAESALGVLPSLLSMGGIWKSSIVPDERTSAFIVAMSVLLTAFAVLGLVVPQRRLLDGRLSASLSAVAVCAVLVAWLPSLSSVAHALDAVVDQVPGLALLRDGHRYVAPAMLVLLPGLASALIWVHSRVRPGRGALLGLIGAVVIAPLVLLPSLVWGAAGRLAPVDYPTEWAQVADLLERSGAADDSMVVLPWTGSYRGFEWNDFRAQLDPAPRFFPGEVLIDDRIYVGADSGPAVLPSETPRLRAVGEALETADPATGLRSAGVRWVLVEHGMRAGPIPVGEVVHDGPGLTLVDLGEPAPRTQPGPDPLVLAGNVLATFLGLFVAFVITRRRTM